MIGEVWSTGRSDAEVLAAIRHANGDRDRLAGLVRRGAVKRSDGEYERAHPGVVQSFLSDITRRVAALAHKGVNLAIRPKRKRRRR